MHNTEKPSVEPTTDKYIISCKTLRQKSCRYTKNTTHPFPKTSPKDTCILQMIWHQSSERQCQHRAQAKKMTPCDSFHITSGYKVLTGCVGTEAGTALTTFNHTQSVPAYPTQASKFSSATPRSRSPACHLCQVRHAAPLASPVSDRVALQAQQVPFSCFLPFALRDVKIQSLPSPVLRG